MALDLALVLLYAEPNGRLRSTARRGYMTIIDGIIAGEGNGPMAADRRPAGLIIAGGNPAAADWVAAELMGFDPRRIKVVSEGFAARELRIADFAPAAITVRNPGGEAGLRALRAAMAPAFRPHFGWVGAIEAENGAVARRR
jgi:hypothetical protein